MEKKNVKGGKLHSVIERVVEMQTKTCFIGSSTRYSKTRSPGFTRWFSRNRGQNGRFLFLMLPFFLGCAAVAPPPGGPEDKTPPSLVKSDPLSGTTHITHPFTVTLTFSERLSESTVEKGIRISPTLSSPLTIKTKKEKMFVSFPGQLSPDQTYILTISREIFDEHKNRLDQTYQLAFTTGSEISEGVIMGRVFNPFGASSTVLLYGVGNEDIDTLFATRPHYHTETDDEGFYSFSYLEPGLYQVVAISGSQVPMSLVPSRMPYGVHWEGPLEIRHLEDSLANVNMRIHRETPPLNVLKAQMETAERGVIRLTNPVDLSEQRHISIVLESDALRKSVEPDLLFQYRDGSHEIYFHSRELDPGESYLLRVEGITDSLEQILSPFEREVIIPPADTTQLEIIYPEKSQVSVAPGEVPLTIQFNDVVFYDPSDTLAKGKKESEEVSVKAEWENPTRLSIIPDRGWEPEAQYEFSLLAYNLRSLTHGTLPDSVIVFHVQVEREVGSGGLSGTVVGRYSEASIVVARPVEKGSIIRSAAVNSDGQFTFKSIPAGFWLLSAYQDKDGDGRYGYGKAIPFEPSEPFMVFPDTIEVRANWDVEGITIRYPDTVESDAHD